MQGDLPDEEVVERCRNGHSEAFAVIVRRYQSRLLRLATGTLAERAEAEDVVQDTFVRAFTKLSHYRPEGKFAAWLYTIFSHCLNDHLRRRKRYGGFLERLTDHLRHEAVTSEKESLSDTSWIRPALARLSEMQRMCILLRDLEQLDTSTVAGRLGINEATVRVHLLRGRRKLREIYEKEIKKP